MTKEIFEYQRQLREKDWNDAMKRAERPVDLSKVPVIKTNYPHTLPSWQGNFIPSLHPEA
jgi:hypothetical protein